jgi:hypothetical protein
VQDTVFEQTDPGAVVGHRAVELDSPASFVFVHNSLADTDGIWVGANGGTVDPFVVRDNLATQIGRYPHPTSGNCCVQFVQLDHVLAPTGVVSWNKVTNVTSLPNNGAGDVVNLYISGGASSTQWFDIGHNLIDGAYPASPADTGYAGGGIMAADGPVGTTTGHVLAHDNTVVSTTNYGVACAAGTDCHATGNVLVNDTFGSDETTHYYNTFGQAHSFHDTTNSDATGDFYNWRRDATLTQYPCWMTSYCAGGTGGTQVATTEQQARDAWTASVPAGELPIGPRS